MSADLDYIFRPRAIAIVGASREEDSFGARVVRCLLEGRYQGPLYPVNPKARVINSLPCYRRVEDIPGPVDLAVVVVPAARVQKAVEQCANKGVKAIVVLSSGFKEVGSKGEELERKLLKLVRKHDLRLVGPNCMGVINTEPEVRMNATFAPAAMGPGRIAFLSQSGAMGVAILKYARELFLGLSMFISVGNKADVSANDLLEYWKNDPATEAVLLYMEGVGNPRRFIQIAREITPRKPVIAVKAGRTASGIQAADSHTGDIEAPKVTVSTDAAADALFRQCGVIRVHTLEEMFDLARAIINQPLPAGNSVAVLTNGGGPGIMASDALEGMELEVPPLDPRTIAELENFLPGEASLKNPVDMRADAGPELYRRSIPLLLEDPNIDALLVIHVEFEYGEVSRAILDQARGADKPVLVCLMGGSAEDPGRRLLQENNIPVYSFPESACRVVRHLSNYRLYRHKQPGRIKHYRAVDRKKVASVFQKVREENRQELTLDEVREVARAYGARILSSEPARSEQDAARIARQVGFPVVVKVLSEKLRKKSDVGGVILDLRTEAEVKKAFHKVMENVTSKFPSAAIEGVQVQQMLKGGEELIVGADHDPVFGPVLKVGAGGVHADIVRDFQFRIVPVTDQEAMDMIRSLNICPLLEGSRGKEGIHLPTLMDLLCRASQLIEDFEEIQEFEINPVIIPPRKKEFFAVDGRMRLFPGNHRRDAVEKRET
ncbi:MAG: acetate--CoA ligase family protein [bacterium]